MNVKSLIISGLMASLFVGSPVLASGHTEVREATEFNNQMAINEETRSISTLVEWLNARSQQILQTIKAEKETKKRAEEEERVAKEKAAEEAAQKEAELVEEANVQIAVTSPTTSFTDAADQALFNRVTQDLSDPAMNGLTMHVKQMKMFLGAKFGITSFSMFRAGDTDGVGTGHGDGLALDLMVPVGSDLGDEIAAYLVANFKSLGINYIIWEQRYYSEMNSIYGGAYTWGLMEDRGSVTQNHYDHVHISFRY